MAELKAKIVGALATPPGSADDQICRHIGPFQLQLRPEAVWHGGGPTALERVQLLPDDSKLEMHTDFAEFSGAKGRVLGVRILDRSK